jgi:hypothetical protein
MPTVNLKNEQWQVLINIIASTKDFPWTMTNPLLMEISRQLQAQQIGGAPQQEPLPTNGKEISP